jgi:hypothetical protein
MHPTSSGSREPPLQLSKISLEGSCQLCYRQRVPGTLSGSPEDAIQDAILPGMARSGRPRGMKAPEEGRVPLDRRMASQCHLLCQVRPSASLGGADALVRSRPPGRLLNDRRCLILRGKSGMRASRADQGVRPTINAESHLSGKVSDIGMPSCPTSDSYTRFSIMRYFILGSFSSNGKGPLPSKRPSC